MEISDTSIQGLKLISGGGFKDSRGSFERLFCVNELTEILGDRQIVQINYSVTKSVGAIRGLHYQKPPQAEMKLIRCLRGKVWDVGLDVRKGSSTFLKYYSVELSSRNGLMVILPEGVAHGFQVLESDSEMLYLHTAPYNKGSESALRYSDPKLSIDWPLPATDLSQRDKSHLLLDNSFKGLFL